MSDRYKLVFDDEVRQSLFGGQATLRLDYVTTRNGNPFHLGCDEWADQSPENLDFMRAVLGEMRLAMNEKANIADMSRDELEDVQGAWISMLAQLNSISKEKTKNKGKEKKEKDKHGR